MSTMLMPPPLSAVGGLCGLAFLFSGGDPDAGETPALPPLESVVMCLYEGGV